MSSKGTHQSAEHIQKRIISRIINNNFIPGAETRLKMRLARLGKPAWNKGIAMTEKTKIRMSLSHLGKKQSDQHIENRSRKLRGKKRTVEQRHRLSLCKMGDKNLTKREDVRLKMSQSQKGKIISPETRKKISIAHKGKKLTKEHIEKIRQANLGRKSHFWNGGIAYNPYHRVWGETLRRSIRERDNYICQICNIPQGKRKHDVHHIDYNKQNYDPNNLITLCHSCHTKTNSKRQHWIKYFNK